MTSPNNNVTMVSRLFRIIRDHPVIVVILVIAIGGVAALMWSNKVTRISTDPGKKAGNTETREDRAARWQSYELGKQVAVIGWYATEYTNTVQGNGADPFANTPDDVSLARNQAASLSRDLKINVDVTQKNFVSPTADRYGYSSGATSIEEVLNAQHGPRAKQAFDTALALENDVLLAQMKRFEWNSPTSEPGPDDAPTEIESLNNSVKAFGADGVDIRQLAGKDQEALNVSARLLIAKLQSNMEQRLQPGNAAKEAPSLPVER
jgi:hypothetical protein